jgi:transposase InsO family protein
VPDGKADKPWPNRLLNAAMPTAPETVRADDITFIPTTDGWLYLAVVIDLYSRRNVGWSTVDNLPRRTGGGSLSAGRQIMLPKARSHFLQ